MKRLFIVKPDGLVLLPDILKALSEKNINILTLKTEKLSDEKAMALYGEHKDRYFFKGLMQYITAKPCVVMLIEGESQKISEAKDNIRKIVKSYHGQAQFDDEKFKSEYLATFDGIHCSDPKSSQREIDLFFGPNDSLLQDIDKENKHAIVEQKLKAKDMPTDQLKKLSLFNS